MQPNEPTRDEDDTVAKRARTLWSEWWPGLVAAAVIVAIAWWLTACTDNYKPPPSAACPAELASSSAVWTYSGPDADCRELASALNDAGDVFAGDDAGEACGGGFAASERDGKCIAELAGECDGVMLELVCDVRSSGAADCRASIELEGLRCQLKLEIR